MLSLVLPPELDERLRQEAERRQQPVETIVLNLLNERLPPVWNEARRAAAIAMLEQWSKEDAELSPEELAENAEVLRMIDENRPAHRKLFTDVLKEIPQ